MPAHRSTTHHRFHRIIIGIVFFLLPLAGYLLLLNSSTGCFPQQVGYCPPFSDICMDGYTFPCGIYSHLLAMIVPGGSHFTAFSIALIILSLLISRRFITNYKHKSRQT